MAGGRKYKSRKMKMNRNMVYGIVGIAIILTLGIVLVYSISPQSPFLVPTTTTPTSRTTISTYSHEDREDVSNFLEIDIWVPKSSAEFDDEEDIYTMSNFELLGSTQEAEDISVDLSDYTYVWIEIDPDASSVFANDLRLIYGGANYHYNIDVYHQSSDVNFNMIDSTTLNEITVADYATDGNYSILFDIPHYTTSNIHANSADWDVDDDQWDDMSASEKEFYYDEKNFRGQYPTFDPSLTTTSAKQNMDLALSDITNAFCFKITCNGTVGADDSVTGINMTIGDDYVGTVYRMNSGSVIYLIFEDDVSFQDGVQRLNLELEFGDNITLSDIDSGRLVIPGHIYAPGTLTFTKYSDIAA